MGSLAALLSYLLMAWGAIRTLRENQRRGVRIDWKRAFIVAGCSILLAAIAGGIMVGAIVLGWPLAGVVLFFAVFLAGIVGMAVAANRIWPPAADT